MRILETTYYTLTVGPDGRWLRLTRNAIPFGDLDAVGRAYEELAPLLRAHARRGVRFLIDLTQGPPGRNDAAFEQATLRLRRLYAETFPDRRLLVRTAAGRLQLLRLNAGLDRDHVFVDAETARQWLEQG